MTVNPLSGLLSAKNALLQIQDLEHLRRKNSFLEMRVERSLIALKREKEKAIHYLDSLRNTESSLELKAHQVNDLQVENAALKLQIKKLEQMNREILQYYSAQITQLTLQNQRLRKEKTLIHLKLQVLQINIHRGSFTGAGMMVGLLFGPITSGAAALVCVNLYDWACEGQVPRELKRIDDLSQELKALAKRIKSLNVPQRPAFLETDSI